MKVELGSSNGWNLLSAVIYNCSLGYTHCVFLLASKLTWRLEVDAKVSELSFVRLAGIFNNIDVEGDSEAVDWQNNRRVLPVDINLWAYVSI